MATGVDSLVLELSDGSSIHATPSSFGGNVAATKARAARLTVVKADPFQGCEPSSIPGSPDPASGFALIVERGGCSFRQKVAIAEKLGASTVLVAETRHSLYTNDEWGSKLKYDCNRGSAWIEVRI